MTVPKAAELLGQASPRDQHWLPAAFSETAAVAASAATILVVEDEELVRNLVCFLLGSCGYRILAAATPEEALHLSQDHQGDVQLLIADLILPRMNGTELAARLGQRHPNMQVLYMSGYPEDVLARQGLTDFQQRFLRKPFSPRDFLQTVRAALEKPAG